MAKPKALTVKRIEKLLLLPGKYTDGDYEGADARRREQDIRILAVALATRPQGPPHGAGLGSEGLDRYLSLAAAREKALEQHERIARDIDPLELKRADRAAKRQAEAMQHTFRQAAEACYDALEPGWSSRHHADEFIRSLERYAFPIIGNVDVAGLDKHSVLRVLEQKLPSRIKGADGGTFWTSENHDCRSRAEPDRAGYQFCRGPRLAAGRHAQSGPVAWLSGFDPGRAAQDRAGQAHARGAL